MKDEYILREDAIDAFNRIKNTLKNPETAHYDTLMFYEIEDVLEDVEPADVVPTESQEIGYGQCANVLLKMWMDNVVTDGEYNRIMDRLNKLYFSGGEREE
jgi:hypothetical protein